MLRDTLGRTGITAAAAVMLAPVPAGRPRPGASPRCTWARTAPTATVWAWPVQPGARPGAWAAALTAFALGAAGYAVRGARPEGPRG
ncbi:hypothetical protein [Streptomyces sp. AGS-58]|uniref:hypothetical protein n=1 Tax=unclassified Streptomyces TaxID=2593676 RepID=UPI0035A3B10A